MDEQRGKMILIMRDGDERPHTLTLGHLQARALAAALYPGGRDIIMLPGGAVTTIPHGYALQCEAEAGEP
jgi:hypothetical protein